MKAAKRKSLKPGQFALPEERKYPVDTAARTRNAAARLEQQKGSMAPATYRKAKAAIGRAAKRFGIESEYNKPAKKRGLSIHADIPQGGRLHVRHMADDDRTVQCDGIALADSDGKKVWIQLAKTGAFAGHPSGPFELNARVFDDIVRNFRASEGNRIPIDFEHASESDPSSGSIPTDGAPAQGWIVDLDNRGHAGLWGLVEWGDKASDYIKGGKYRYFSPAIRFNAKDPVTGERVGARMTSGALTNQPFLRGMVPLAASDRRVSGDIKHAIVMAAYCYSSNEFMPRMRACMKLGELASPAECSDHLDKLSDLLEMAGGDHEATVHGVHLAEHLKPLRELVGASMHHTWDEVFDAVRSLIRAAIDEHEVEEHGGEDDDEPMSYSDDTTDQASLKDNAMANDANELTSKLSATESSIADLKAKNEALSADNAALKAKLDKLEAEAETRRASDREAYVDMFLSANPDRKGDRAILIQLMTSSEELFRKTHRVDKPEHRYLTQKLVPERDNTPVTQHMPVVDDLVTTAKRLMKDEKLSYDAAYDKADKLIRRQRASF